MQLPIVVSESGSVMDVSERHSLKANPSIVVTESGSVMDVSDEHSTNAHSSIVVSESGSVMDVSEEQLAKASHPIVVRELGRVMDVSEEQPRKGPPNRRQRVGQRDGRKQRTLRESLLRHRRWRRHHITSDDAPKMHNRVQSLRAILAGGRTAEQEHQEALRNRDVNRDNTVSIHMAW